MSQSGLISRSVVEAEAVLEFTGGAGTAGTFPVVPNGSGQIQLSSTGGSIQITGLANGLNLEATGSPLILATLTGNSGGSVAPTANNINTIGSGNITTIGNPLTSTLTTTLTGLVDHALVVGNGTSAFTNLPIGATNQVLLGLSGNDPIWGQVPNSALSNSSVTINSGNNITVTGGSPLALGGTASIAVTGTTNHDVQVGNASGSLTSVSNGSTGQVFQANTNADPTWSTATYPSTATGTGTILRADGTNWVPTNAVYPNSTTINQILFSSANNNITGIAAGNDGVLISGASGIPSWLANGSTGQVLTATTGSTPSWQNASVPPAVVLTLTGNGGGAVAPTTNNINTVGTGSITVSGNPGTSTLTTELTGLTNHAVLVGAGTATITNVGPSATAGQVFQSQGALLDPAFSTATYPSTATGTGTILRADGTNWVATTATYPATTIINQLLYSSANNTVGGLATGNDGVLITSDTGVPSFLANGTTGYVLTATAGSPPSWQPAASNFTPNALIQDFDDFIGSTIASKLGWVGSGIGFGVFDALGGSSAHPGTVSSASVTTPNTAGILLGQSALQDRLILGGGSLSLNFVINISNLSTPTNRYTLYVGLLATSGSTLATVNNGCYFKYSDNLNSGKWIIENNKASSLTTGNSNSTVATGWINLGISINAAATSVTYTINGVAVNVSPLATNIPTALVSPGLGFVCSAGTIPQATIQLDLFYYTQSLTTPR